jgi:hypothetical protein
MVGVEVPARGQRAWALAMEVVGMVDVSLTF